MQKWLEVIMTTERSFLPHLVQLLMSKRIKTWAEEEENGIVRLKVYIPYFEGVEEYLTTLRKVLEVEKVDVVTREIEDEDWAHSWQKFFDVQRIGDRIVIKPPWKEYEPQPEDIVLEIEPRMAFGSGYHPTTSGTLALMEKYVKPGMSILDMGCGSGILSITAAHLGASRITGADNDDICTREATENYSLARQKHPQLTENASFILSDGFTEIKDTYDILMLNVHSDFILGNIDGIVRSLKPGGLFISGSVGVRKEEEIKQRFEEQGLQQVERIEHEGWIGVVFRKTESDS